MADPRRRRTVLIWLTIAAAVLAVWMYAFDVSEFYQHARSVSDDFNSNTRAVIWLLGTPIAVVIIPIVLGAVAYPVSGRRTSVALQVAALSFFALDALSFLVVVVLASNVA